MASEETRATFAQRAGNALDRAEHLYLKVLRAVILVIATLLLGLAAWLAVSSLYKVSRSPDSVIEAEASVAPDELTDAEMPAPPTTQGTPESASSPARAHQKFYSTFVDGYYQLYRSKFEPYRQAEDKILSRAEFDGAFLNTQARLSAIKDGDLDFASDKADLETLMSVMAQAAERPKTIERLQRYKVARKVPVTRQVERTRVTYVDGWDSSSTACSDWYETPYGCPIRRPVESTYTENVQSLEFPEGTQSHTQIFKAFQDRYFELLDERRTANSTKAERDRQTILEGIANGRLAFVTALQILGGFLVLMFFFLLIAIERHQRRLAAPSSGERAQ